MSLKFIKKKKDASKSALAPAETARAPSFELPDFKRKEKKKRKGGGWWWFGRAGQGLLQGAQTSTGAEAAAAASRSVFSAGAESAASVARVAAQAASSAVSSMSAWVPSTAVLGKIVLGGIGLAFVGGAVAALLSTPRQIHSLLHMAAPGFLRPIPVAAPNSLAYASRLPKGWNGSVAAGQAGSRPSGKNAPLSAAGPHLPRVLPGGVPVLGAASENGAAPGMSAPPGGMFAPQASSNQLQAFSGHAAPQASHDSSLAQAVPVAPGSIATPGGGQVATGLMALGQLRTAGSVGNHVMQGANESSAVMGQQVFDNPAGSQGAGGGAQVTGAGDGYGASSVINGGPGGAAAGGAGSGGGAPVGGGSGLGQCTSGNLGSCGQSTPANNPQPASNPDAPLMSKSLLIAAAAGMALVAIAVLARLPGTGPALAIAGAALVSIAGATVMALGAQMLSSGTNPNTAYAVMAMGASLIAGGWLAALGGPFGYIGAAMGLINSIAAIGLSMTQ